MGSFHLSASVNPGPALSCLVTSAAGNLNDVVEKRGCPVAGTPPLIVKSLARQQFSIAELHRRERLSSFEPHSVQRLGIEPERL